MQKEYYSAGIENIARQRNVFIAMCLTLLLALILVSTRLVLTDNKTILVPGLLEEAWVSESGVSGSYLEQGAAMYLPLLLDLDSQCIRWKRDRVLQFVSHSDSRYLKALSDYFARVKEQYDQFSLSTHFALKKLESDSSNLTVRAYGKLISRFGNRGFEEDEVIYGISFEWVNGRLLLKEFVKLEKEDLDD